MDEAAEGSLDSGLSATKPLKSECPDANIEIPTHVSSVMELQREILRLIVKKIEKG